MDKNITFNNIASLFGSVLSFVSTLPEPTLSKIASQNPKYEEEPVFEGPLFFEGNNSPENYTEPVQNSATVKKAEHKQASASSWIVGTPIMDSSPLHSGTTEEDVYELLLSHAEGGF